MEDFQLHGKPQDENVRETAAGAIRNFGEAAKECLPELVAALKDSFWLLDDGAEGQVLLGDEHRLRREACVVCV
jgi:HEAT repeat protein